MDEQEKRRVFYKQSMDFFDKLDSQISQDIQDKLAAIKNTELQNKNAIFKYMDLREDAYISVIKRDFSSTHSWKKDIEIWKNDNWYWYDYGCQKCGLFGSRMQYPYSVRENIIVTDDLPVLDYHVRKLRNTCEELQKLALDKRYEQCGQCGIYNCEYNANYILE